MKRRELLESIPATYGALSVGGPSGADEGAEDRRRAGTGPSDAAATSGDPSEPVTTDDGSVSLRRIGERMDPERPATRVRGHGTPHGRPAPDEYDDNDGLAPADTYSHDASHLPRSVNRSRVVANAYDFGMAHRKDKGVVEQHRFTESEGRRPSVRDVVDRHASDESREFKWLFLNVFLPYMAGFGGSDYYNAGDYWDRRPEIGWTIRDEGYDVACLCEAFKVIEAVGQCANPFRGEGAYLDPTGEIVNAAGNVEEVVRGPDRYNDSIHCNATDSGLREMLLDSGGGSPPRLVRHKRNQYDPDDMELPDARGNKGWSYLEVDLGVGEGNVDLFHTHMQSGGHPEARNGQLSTLMSAVDRHSRPENVTVVGGDMNYAGDKWRLKGKPNYKRLVSEMDARGLQDAWLTYGGVGQNTSIKDPARDPSSLPYYDTDDCGTADYRVTDGSAKKRGVKYQNCVTDDCGGNHSKLDYVFVERPKPDHRLNLDLRRVRRRVFPRKGGCSIPTGGHDTSWTGEELGPGWDEYTGEFNYLGDHLGVELRTVVSPK